MEIRIGAKKLLHKARRSSPPSPPQFLLLAVINQALLLLLLCRTTPRDSRCDKPSSRHINPTTTHGPRRAEATHADLKPTHPWSHADLKPPTPISIFDLLQPMFLSLGFFFFFFSGVLRVINRVLKTRFLGGRHVEKMPHQT